jgi:hypothetical protein
MGSTGRPDLVAQIQEYLTGRPSGANAKPFGHADLVTAEEEVRLRRKLGEWSVATRSPELLVYPGLAPTVDLDGLVMPQLVEVAANYVRAVSLAFCEDVLVGGFPHPLELVDLVQGFPLTVAIDIFQRHDFGIYLLSWELAVDSPEFPDWARDAAIAGPIDSELFALLVGRFAKHEGERIPELIRVRVDRFWEDHARVLREIVLDSQDQIAVAESGTDSMCDRQALLSKRASWLKQRMGERGWTKHDISRQRGPDHKTVQKVLNGYRVGEAVLERIAFALNSKREFPSVSILDFPSD